MAKKSTPAKSKSTAAKKAKSPAARKPSNTKAIAKKKAPTSPKKAVVKKAVVKKTAPKTSKVGTKNSGVNKKATASSNNKAGRKKVPAAIKKTPATIKKTPAAIKKIPAAVKKTTVKKPVPQKPSHQTKAVKTAEARIKKQTAVSTDSVQNQAGNKPVRPTPNPKPSTGLPITRVSLVKKATPVSFSLEDVEEVLNTRKSKGESSLDAAAKPAAVAPTPAKTDKLPVADKLPIEKRKHGAASLMDILGFNPKEKKSPIDLDPDEVPAKWKKYYKLLLDLREHVKAELDLHTSETLKHSTREDSGDLSGYAQHQADAATDSFDRDFALSLLSSEQDALYEIEEAIKRIRNGAYGRCEVTGESIPKERLLAVPFTRFSIEGQREFEKNKRRKVDRGTAFADNSDGVSLAGDDDDDE
jgi:RNA polymerase-binding transcription factor DksA